MLACVVATAVGDGASDVPGASGVERTSVRTSVAAAPVQEGAEIECDGISSNTFPASTAGSLGASTRVDSTDVQHVASTLLSKQNAPDDPPDADVVAMEPAVKRRKRGAAKIESDIVELRVKESKKIHAINSEVGKVPSTKREQTLQRLRSDLVKLQNEIAARQELLQRTKLAEEAKVAREAAAQKARADASERACAMSEAGSRTLVELVMKHTPRLVNTSDTVDAVWQHIHHAFMQLVTKGDLPETDGRSASALRHR